MDFGEDHNPVKYPTNSLFVKVSILLFEEAKDSLTSGVVVSFTKQESELAQGLGSTLTVAAMALLRCALRETPPGPQLEGEAMEAKEKTEP